MKLSAPPPPPPPPPGDETPGANAPGSPDSPNNPPVVPTPDAPETPPAPTPPGPKPLKWPAWFSGIDATLVGLVLVFAFMAASFVARNSDIWLHLAAGKRLLAGQYTPGSDPFSYSAADRPWVNHSWLAGAGAYLLYGGSGVVLCVVKALAVTLAFGLLIAIRRPQFPLWPWAAVACVAVLAAAPQFALRPVVLSILFLSITMYLLFRMPQKPNTWRFPIAIGATFWLWANCDQWFFIGPLALALLIVGDLIQTKLFNSPDEPPADGVEEPLGRLPDTATLAKALGVGVLACMLNPHHFRVWELPVELTKLTGVESDLRLRLPLLAPTDALYSDNVGQGNNLNGLAYAVVFIAGALALGFGPGRARVSHIVLWVGFAALSLWSVAAIPFLAVIAVPLIAAQLNAFSSASRAELKSWGDPLSRVLYIGSAIGRIASVLAICVLCVIAYPGWAQPETANPATARRVAWGVEPDPALVQAAEQFKIWRESGKLPADTRGFVANIELANYLAWYAPQEKVFVNARINHHKPELRDYVAVRRGLGLIDTKDESKLADATDILRKWNAEYVAIYSAPGEGIVAFVRAGAAVSMLYREPSGWSPWYLDGRTTVFGWHPAEAPPGPAFAALRIDPVVLALGPNVEPLPNKPPESPLVPLGWEEAFVRPPKMPPPGVAEAIGWIQFKQGPAVRQERRRLLREGLVMPFFFGAPATTGTMHGFAVQVGGSYGYPFPPNDATDPGVGADATAARASPILALRAARRAIAADPEHPDPYYALALALSDSDLPLTESERTLGRVVALRQCLIRMPAPERYKRGQFTASATDVAFQLVFTYLGQPVITTNPRTGQQVVRGYPGMPIDVAPLNDLLGQMVLENVQNSQAPLERRPFVRVQAEGLPRNLRPVTGNVPHFLPLDAARETLQLALRYLPIDLANQDPDDAKKRADQLEMIRKEIDNALIRANELYNSEKVRGSEVPRLVEAARFSGLPGEAIELLKQLNDQDTMTKEYKDQSPYAVVLWASLTLALGRIEDSSDLLKKMESPEWVDSLERTRHVHGVRLLRYQKALHAGEYKTAGEVLESGEGRDLGLDILMTELARNKMSANELLFAEFMTGPPAAPGGGLMPSLVFQWGLQSRAERAVQAREVIASKLQRDARYFYRRGMLAVLEGDIRAAKQWFQQAERKPPDRWELRSYVQVEAVRYLRMIELAERKAAAP